MAILCKNGGEKHYHESKGEVKLCWEDRYRKAEENGHDSDPFAGLVAETIEDEVADPISRHKNEASERQLNFIRDLVEERDTTVRGTSGRFQMLLAMYTDSETKPLTKPEASELITALQSLPPRRSLRTPQVPDGRYALVGGGIVEFFQVKTPTEGRWAGFTFVDHLVGAPGDFAKYPRKREHKQRVLDRILEAGVEESLRLFGQEVGICGVCGSPLTNEESRAFGIGPVCRSK